MALISKHESALLNMEIRSSVHVTYGDSMNDILPEVVQFSRVNALFRKAMAGGICGIIISGREEDGSNFASAQVSMQTAAMRMSGSIMRL